ncbi:MAG: GNAT family N-acetyltransferase [Anaerolineales bacterium]|nr:GNAT family N-acetyltransferase [Anaerolineales bacterium]
MIYDRDLIVRKADKNDRDQLVRLLQKRSFIHRHLGWFSPLEWLGDQPYLVLEKQSSISAAIACPPDDDGLTWLHLFAVTPGLSIHQAWRSLWPPALEWLEENTSVQQVNSLVVQNKMIDLLSKSGFQESYRVVVLVWDAAHANWPEQMENYLIRDMEKEDFLRIYEIDQLAFDPIWRNSLSHIDAAFQEKISASVVVINNRIAGYQISTINPQGGHLARLAVDPEYQKSGVGSALVDDLLDRFQREGIVQVSVNTQVRNQASLEFYKKFGFKRLDEIYPVYQYTLDR